MNLLAISWWCEMLDNDQWHVYFLKLKWLNRLASLQADGTVQFEIPDEIKPQNLAFGTKVVASGATEEEDFNTTTLPDLPPLQIVMLIVGTRGDVQPFVAIGKCLQVEYILPAG